MKKYDKVTVIAFIVGYFILSTTLSLLTTSFLSVWLGINVGLALVPLFLVTVLFERTENKEYAFDWVSTLLIVLFILFLPNAFYVITDFIHIDSSDFYRVLVNGETLYKKDLQHYLLLAHIALSFLIAMYAFIKSILRIDYIMKQRFVTEIRHLFIFLLFVSSSVGIYIGRFLRFFSWDVLNPIKLITAIFNDVSMFMFGFILLFTLLQYIVYYGYRILLEKEPF